MLTMFERPLAPLQSVVIVFQSLLLNIVCLLYRRLESIIWRSEEHTSELQSQSNLVCRLLLEKKKLLHRELRGPPHVPNRPDASDLRCCWRRLPSRSGRAHAEAQATVRHATAGQSRSMPRRKP